MASQYEDVNKILSSGEEVLFEYKPNKLRYTVIGNIVPMLFAMLFGAVFFAFGLLGAIGIIANSDPSIKWGFIVFIVVGAIPMLGPLVNFIGRFVRYKNEAYIVTNERIIIRSGFIGIDYREMSLKSISSMNVRVDFLDKLFHPNTGILYFASAANPVFNDPSQKNNYNTFKFEYIENPYDAYKEIKEILPQ